MDTQTSESHSNTSYNAEGGNPSVAFQMMMYFLLPCCVSPYAYILQHKQPDVYVSVIAIGTPLGYGAMSTTTLTLPPRFTCGHVLFPPDPSTNNLADPVVYHPMTYFLMNMICISRNTCQCTGYGQYHVHRNDISITHSNFTDTPNWPSDVCILNYRRNIRFSHNAFQASRRMPTDNAVHHTYGILMSCSESVLQIIVVDAYYKFLCCLRCILQTLNNLPTVRLAPGTLVATSGDNWMVAGCDSTLVNAPTSQVWFGMHVSPYVPANDDAAYNVPRYLKV